MKHLKVPFVSNQDINGGIAGVSAFLDTIKKQKINNLLWSDNGYKPNVDFAIAYTENSILLKYFVSEKYFKADFKHINDPVYQDSCVEFFIAFGDDEGYYNLEFNPIGTALIAYGSGKNDRKFIDAATIAKIQSKHNIASSPNKSGDAEWNLTLNIPFTLFTHHNITSLSRQFCRVNFYKCGDDLPIPHFICWNGINNPTPNFHLPQFFSSILFDK